MRACVLYNNSSTQAIDPAPNFCIMRDETTKYFLVNQSSWLAFSFWSVSDLKSFWEWALEALHQSKFLQDCVSLFFLCVHAQVSSAKSLFTTQMYHDHDPSDESPISCILFQIPPGAPNPCHVLPFSQVARLGRAVSRLQVVAMAIQWKPIVVSLWWYGRKM